MALTDQSANGAVLITETILVTGHASGTLIKAGMVTVTNDHASTSAIVQVGVRKAGAARVNLLKATLAAGVYWYSDGDIILEDATDTLVAISDTTGIFTYNVSFYDDFLT